MSTSFTGALQYITKYEIPKSLTSIISMISIRKLALKKSSINPDLMGLGSLVSEKFTDFKHSDKKVLTLSFIAIAMGMYRP